ncbi:hypothetical protein ACFVY0_40370 [Streptomyces sp. NPDC058286]|uniref:hypothetical protein n=1 Tax=Streptomyces sp. NPDC058286 TaxID=3346422 RepID=UPI0036E40F0C
MSPKRTATAEHIEIPGICFIRQPESTLRCTLSADHHGEHQHCYSGPLTHGFRAGTTWPRRAGETQAD